MVLIFHKNLVKLKFHAICSFRKEFIPLWIAEASSDMKIPDLMMMPMVDLAWFSKSLGT